MSSTDDIRRTMAKGADAAHEELEALSRQAQSIGHAAREGIERAQSVVEREVRENPVQSLAIAMGAGLAMGLLLARR